MAKRKRKSQYRSRPRANAPRPRGDAAQPARTAYEAQRRQEPAARRQPDAARVQEQRRTSEAGNAAASQRRTRPAPVKKSRRREKLPRNVEPFTFEEAKRTRPRRRKESSGRTGEILYRVLLTAMICAALFFIASVFFEVKTIEVTGTSRYLPEYVAELSGVESGDKLLFINRFQISQNLFEKLPFVKEIKVRRRFPNTVLIELTERTPAAKLVSGGISYIIDEEAFLLEYTALGDEYRLPVINGAAPSEYQPGRQLVFEDGLMLESLKSILAELVKSDWIANISEINLEKIYNISFQYANRFTVVLGDASELEYKLAVFRVMLERLKDTDQGTIDLSTPEMARFQPYTT
ncbi:MAG: FtsQ-type POTRA domain-containing protein [Clostridiaceae bacterium]|nr:FtsQ-type POTRA domain-containing protein [Clostridiaceae bacterium]